MESFLKSTLIPLLAMFEKFQLGGCTRLKLIRSMGASIVLLYCLSGFVSPAFYDQRNVKVNADDIIKIESGLTEIQCALKCRRNAACKYSHYQEKEKVCNFLKAASLTTILTNSVDGTLHVKIPVDKPEHTHCVNVSKDFRINNRYRLSFVNGRECHSSNRVESFVECQHRCQAHRQCLSFVFRTEEYHIRGCQKMCMLTSHALEEKIMVEKIHFIAGPKFCPV